MMSGRGGYMKRIANDVFLSVISMGISTGILQIIIYPLISSYTSIEEFGLLLTTMGLVNVIAVVFGGSLNNTQLIDKRYYNSDNSFFGDFKRVFFTWQPLIVALTFLILLLPFFSLSWVKIAQIIILVVLTTARSYLPVLWRLQLSYDRILWHSMITSIGYILGSVIFIELPIIGWPSIFIIGEFFSLLYLLVKTQFIHYSLSKSDNYKRINKDYISLLSSNIVANTLTYFDRFILQGLMGAEEVSIFFAASIFGKLSSLILQPISGVMLSYLSRKDDKEKKKYFSLFLLLSVSSGVLLFLISLILSPIMVKILYPTLYTESIKIMTLSNLSVIILIVGSLLQPIILKFSKLYWQNVVQTIYAISFASLGYFLTMKYQLVGFVVASLTSNIIRFCLFAIVGYISIWREKND